jgi:hypothetical protein
MHTHAYFANSGLSVMKKWQKGHNEYFSHLEHVSKLPEAYESFLLEIVRRRAYDKVDNNCSCSAPHATKFLWLIRMQIFELKVRDCSNDIASFRASETSRRDVFLRSALPHLPPLFFKMVPSLNEKPPYFTPSLTAVSDLPCSS